MTDRHLEGTPQFTEVWAPKRYADGPLVGAGRWCPIFSPIDQPPIGWLFTDDDQVLGFLQAGRPDVQAISACQVVQDALLGAAALDRPASGVFDAWAARDGRGLAAGPVVVGDLRELVAQTS